LVNLPNIYAYFENAGGDMKKHTTPGGVFPATWSFHAAAAKVGGRFATDFFCGHV